MNSVDPPPSGAVAEVLAVFDQSNDPSVPLSAREVADRAGCAAHSASDRLDELVEQGALKTRSIEGRTRVWWRPTLTEEPTADEGRTPSSAASLSAFVRTVEEYAIFTLDPDGRIVSWNDGAERIKGYTSEEVLGEHFSMFYTEADRERGVPEQNLGHAADRGRLETEGRRVRKDGSEFWASVEIAAVRDDDGTLLGYTKVTRDMTDYREHERQLVRERDQMRELMKTSPVAISVRDADGEMVLTNQRARELLDLTEETLGGPEDADEWRVYDAEGEPLSPAQKPSSRVLATGEPVYDEVIAIEPPDGERLWFSVNAAPVFGPDGSLERVVTTGEDITELKRQARDIRRQRDDLRDELAEVFDRVTDAFFGLDEAFRFTHINTRAEELIGRSEADVLGEVIWEAAPATDALVDPETLTEAMETGESTTDERYFDARSTWFEVRVYPSETGASVYLTDISERKRLERELRTEKEQFRVAVENSPLVAFRLDTDLRYTWVANAHDDFDADEVLGKRDDDLLPAEAAEVIMAPKRKALETGERVREEVTYELPSGLVSYDLTVEPLRDETGDIVGLTAASYETTDRKRAEAELSRSEERLRLALEAGDLGAWELDLESGASSRRSSHHDRIFGYEEPLDEWNFERFLEHVHPADRTRIEESFETALEEGEWTFECRIVRTDGEERWIEARGEFSYDEAGDPTRAVGVVQDVTEQKEYQLELERYRRIVETVDEGIYIVDSDDRFTMVNEAYTELTGYDREELLGSPASMVVEEETVETARDVQRELVSGERDTARFEADIRTATGETVRAEATFAVLPSDDSRYERIGVVRDITDRKEYERQLETRVRQQQTITELGRRALENPDLDVLFDEAIEAVADTLNSDYCKVLERLPNGEELLLRSGCGWKDGYVGEATVETDVRSQAGYTLISETPVVVDDLETEDRFEGPDLLLEHGVVSGISTIIGPFDDPWGVLGVHDTVAREFTVHDVNFVQAVANILSTAIERNGYEQRLTATIDELEESNERLEQFAYVASHDLQEPLRMVSNYLRLLENRYRDELDDDANDFIDFAVDGADRMREMISGLLQYSRVEQHSDALEPTDTDVVVDRVLDSLQVQIEELDAEVEVGALPTVAGDNRLLEQLFQNLLSNALKYRGDEPPHVEIGATRRGDEWVFRVADNGIGIDPQYTDQIFKVFNRLHTHDEYQGTGIGLTLCRRIVDRHGGEIWVESTPGEGSTFFFTLPDEERCT